MELKEVMSKRRSVRSFKAGQIDDSAIAAILKAGTMAPSAGNTQCTRFYVVKDEKIRRSLALEAGHQEFIASTPVLVVVVADLSAVGGPYGERGRTTYALQDTAAAIENMLLTIVDLGLSTCWIGAFDEEKARKILNLSKELRPVAMLPIGYADKFPKNPPPKSDLASITTYL